MTSTQLDPGQLIGGRWRIDRFLASGGFGRVYEATDVSSAAIGSVAVKGLLEGASTAERQSFLAEARHMSALRHPNLVSHIDSGLLSAGDGAVFLVIDLCDESLGDHCLRQPGGTLTMEQLVPLVRDIGSGLGYLHQSGRVHRDLKPGNILRSGDRWKLADFGLVRDLSQSGVYHLESLVGSPRYMAPEFFTDGMVGPAADIWAVGIIANEVMTGQTAFSGEGPAYIHNLTSTEPAIEPALPGEVQELIRRCLAPDPADRPTAADLEPILTGRATAEPVRPDVRSDEVTGPVAAPVAPPAPVAAGAPSQSTGPVTPPRDPAPQPVAASVPAAATGPSSTGPTGPTGSTIPTDGRPPTDSMRRWWPIALIAVLALIAGGTLVAVLAGSDDEADTVAAGTAGQSGDDEAGGEGDASGQTDTDDGADEGTSPVADEEGDTADGEGDDPVAGGDDADEADDTTDGSSDDDVTEEAPSSPTARAMVGLGEFSPGDCADIEDIDRFVIDTIVPCADPHLFEVLAVFEAPSAGQDYPGADSLFQTGLVRCTQAFLDRFGIDQADTSLSILTFYPEEAEWADRVFNIICVMYRADFQPLTQAIGSSVDDWTWKPGDTLTVVELQSGHCFDLPVGLEPEGFDQRVVFADCAEPHDGEYYETFLLELDEGVSPSPDTFRALGAPLCHEELHARLGPDHAEADIDDTVIVQTTPEYERTISALALCLVVFDEPRAGTLAELYEAR